MAGPLSFLPNPLHNSESSEIAFIRVELQTGLMFSKIASEARYQDKRDRNCRNARRAYDALVYFIPKLHSPKFIESDAMTHGLAQLKSELQQLGQEF